MGRLFGTDGIRGVAFEFLNEELAYKTAVSAVKVLAGNKTQKVIIGRDTRISGKRLSDSMIKGFSDAGADVSDLGVIPTPAIAYLIKKYNADMGVMISASHNPYEYNGIKLFASDGCKLPDSTEDEIEKLINGFSFTPAEKKGRIDHCEEAAAEYADFVASSSPCKDLSGIKAVVDCACGASSVTAKRIFDSLSLSAAYIHNEPNGKNINDNCGSTHLQSLIAEVKKQNADIGLAFDGDADRFLAVCKDGRVLDGDRIIAALAIDMNKKGILKNSSVAVTVMTNMGFLSLMEEHGIRSEITSVGDRYVLSRMKEKGLSIGGEQSGHIILLDINCTGDGEMTAAFLLSYMKESGSSAEDIAEIFESYPQVLLNLKADAKQKEILKESEKFKEEIAKSEKIFGKNGRILIRPSGTEPLVRIMAEGKSDIKETVASEAKRLLSAAEKIINCEG